MPSLQQLRERKIVQWAVAYAAAAWVVLQVLDLAAGSYGWPGLVMRLAFGLVLLGFVVTLLLAWYHGERGQQKVSGTELLIISLVLAVGGGLVWRSNLQAPADGAVPAQAAAPTGAPAAQDPRDTGKSIAVLPFENLSSDKGNEYFVSGMQDMILTSLSKIDGLKVISRTSTEKYASQPANLRQVAAELGVRHILEGSVQRVGDQVLINLQLIDASNDSHVWADSFDRQVENVFSVEREVARLVADTLRTKLIPAEARAAASAPTQDKQAYDLYLRARYEKRTSWGQRDAEPLLEKAIAHYEQAIAADPGFALAHAGLASARLMLYWEGGSRAHPQSELAAQALEAAQRARQLAPDLLEADLAFAEYQYRVELDYRGSLASYDAILARHPGVAEAHFGRGLTLRRLGRFDESIAAYSAAVALNPRDSQVVTDRGLTRFFAGHLRGADADLRLALEIDPADATARGWLAYLVYYLRGDAGEVLALYPERNAESSMRRAEALGRQGKYAQALDELALEPDRRSGVLALMRGELLARMGRSSEVRTSLLGARATFRESLAHLPENSGAGQGLRFALARTEALLGNEKQALDLVAQGLALLPVGKDAANGAVGLGMAAEMYARLGRIDLVLPMLERIRSLRGTDVQTSSATLRKDPVWDKVRDDPRFQAEVARFVEHEKSFD